MSVMKVINQKSGGVNSIKIKLKVFRPIFPSDSRPDLQIARMPADIYVHRLTKCFRYLSIKQMLYRCCRSVG